MQTFMLIMHLAFMGLGIGMSCSNFVNTRLAAGKTGDIARPGPAAAHHCQYRRQYHRGHLAQRIHVASDARLGRIERLVHAKIAFVVLLTLSHIMARRTGAEMMRTAMARCCRG